MNPINLLGFAGAAQAPNVRLLSENVGADVVDAEPGGGELKPLRDRLTVATVPSGSQRQTIYRMGRDNPDDANYWLSWTGAVSVMRSFDSQDTTERIYYSGDGSPKWTNTTLGLAGGPPYPQGARELGVPAPVVAAITTLNTDGTGDAGLRFYVHTFVNDLGWESAPSPVSTGLTCKPGAIVDITGLPAAPAGNYGINRRRLYRTQPGSADGAANFYFLREVGVGATTTQDDGRALGELIATVGWQAPPADAKSLIGLWNGMAAFITGKTVSITEPYAPYASKVRNDHEILDTPVALAKWEQNLLVLTTGKSVVLQGQDPESMSETGVTFGHPCASARSVVAFPHGVVWASQEGLAYTGAAEVITTGVFKPTQWRALKPETMVAGRYGRHYVASYTVAGVKKGLMFDPLRPQDGIWFLSAGFDACFYDELADALYVLEGGNVRKFDAAAARLTTTFRSKVFRQVGPRNFAWGKVVADSYPTSGARVTLKVWADGVLRMTRTVASADPFTLPSGFMAEDWQLEVSGPVPIQAVHLATDVRDFKAV